MKNRFKLFSLLLFIIPLASCGINQVVEIGDIDLYNANSEFYYGPVSSIKMPTYRNSEMGDVPFVNFKDIAYFYNTFANYSGVEVVREGSEYILKRSNYNLYKFNVNTQELIIFKDIAKGLAFPHAKNGDVSGDIIYEENADKEVIRTSEKSHYIAKPYDKTIKLANYNMQVVEKDNELYVPFHLNGLIFESTDRNEHFLYNGKDFFLKNSSQFMSLSLYNSSNYNFIMPYYFVYNGSLDSVNLDMKRVNADNNSKYRFETTVDKTVFGSEFDVSFVMNLTSNGYGSLKMYNKDTGNEVYLDSYSRVVAWEFNSTRNIINTAINLVSIDQVVTNYPVSFNTDDAFYLKKYRSAEYAKFDFNYLKMYFEQFYGMADHPARHFNKRVNDISINSGLTSTNAADYESALSKFLLIGVDDCHTGIIETTPFTGKKSADLNSLKKLYPGERMNKLRDLRDKYFKLRFDYLGTDNSNYLPYQVVNNTAYITFDSFEVGRVMHSIPSYKNINPNDLSNDTTYLIGSSMYQITKNSNIKNIVFDLTCNGGGDIRILPYLLALMSKDPVIFMSTRVSYDLRELHYKVDLNGDEIFGDKEDTYEGKYNFYILTSEFSFSCANAFPTAVKNLKCGKIIGKQSGGGPCIVGYVTTPSGFYFNVSSPYAFMIIDRDRNVYKHNDSGVPVDYEIDSSIWYDRTALTSKINTIN